LNPVHSNRKRINQVETLGVFGKHRRERAKESKARLANCTKIRVSLAELYAPELEASPSKVDPVSYDNLYD
jgi:hypothetical protein